APSLMLALSAFLLLEKSTTRRWAIAILFMILAHWVNVSLFTLLGPLVALHYFVHKQPSDLNRLLPCLSIGAIAGLIMMRASHYRGITKLGVDPVQDWLTAWTQQVHAIFRLETSHLLIFLVWVAPAAAVVLSRLILSGMGTKSLAAAAVLAGSGVVNW